MSTVPVHHASPSLRPECATMPRPQLPSHLSLQRWKSNTSINGDSTPKRTSSTTSIATTHSSKMKEQGDHKGMGLVLRVQVLKVRTTTSSCDVKAKSSAIGADMPCNRAGTLHQRTRAAPVIQYEPSLALCRKHCVTHQFASTSSSHWEMLKKQRLSCPRRSIRSGTRTLIFRSLA